MNILIIVKSIDGGTGTFVINLLKIKKLLKCNISTLVLERPSYRNFSKYKFRYMRKKNFYPNKYSLTSRNLYNFFSEFFWLSKQIKKISPDIVLSIDLRCNLLVLFLKFIFLVKAKVVITNHINLSDTVFVKSTGIVSVLLKKFVKFFYNRADIIVAVSKGLSKSIKKDFGVSKPVLAIYNGLKVRNSKIRRLNKNKVISFISVGRLGEQKDFETLIMAFKNLNLTKRKAQMNIIGDGPDRKFLQLLIKENGLSEKVFLKGWSSNVSKELRASDIFVHSSRREGFAYVILEAMACGLPVISTNSKHGPSEILNNGEYGLLTKVGDAKMLSNAMNRVANDIKEYSKMSKLSASRVAFFSVEKMLEGYKKIFNELYE